MNTQRITAFLLFCLLGGVANTIHSAPVKKKKLIQKKIVKKKKASKKKVVKKKPVAVGYNQLLYKATLRHAQSDWPLPLSGRTIQGRFYTRHALERMAPSSPKVMGILSDRAQKLGYR
ncbi:MAG TPA: hypothetical protein VLG71_03155, partial [Candidatus Limnocylindria bacterium]|nr:hypothetical protein [Candidatus Limnocylindria bacterium]